MRRWIRSWMCLPAAILMGLIGSMSPLAVSSASTDAHAALDRFRLGLIVGAPVALAAAVDFDPRFAMHASLSPPSDRSNLGLRLDLVYRVPDIADEIAEVALLSIWFGPGLRWTIEDEVRSHVGVRVPFGLSLHVPGGGELFAEIAPALVLHPERRALVEAGLGLRFGLF